MAILDWIVLGLFCLGLVGIIFWVTKKKNETSTDYFLAGRDATWLAIGASIFASNIGSEHLVGLAGAGASSGMAMAHWEMHGWIILILGWFFVPFYARSGVFTMPEFLEKRYNRGSRSVLSIISTMYKFLSSISKRTLRTCLSPNVGKLSRPLGRPLLSRSVSAYLSGLDFNVFRSP